jgi:predicted membrane metal-binding protein
MRKRPLLIASVGFTFGVLYGPAELPWVDVIAGLFLLAVARRRKFRFPIMQSAFIWGGAFFLGLPIGSIFLPGPESIEAPATLIVEASVIEAPDRGLLADGLVVDVVRTATSAETPFTDARGRLLLRVPHPAGEAHPAACGLPGERIRATVQVSPRRPSLVAEFRSRKLAVRRGVQLYGEVIGSCVSLGDDSPRTFLADAIARAIDRASPDHAALLGALATGDRTGVLLATEARFVHAGLGHVLELHGLVVALFVFALLYLLRARPRLARQLAIPLLVLGALLYGGTPSIFRTVMVLACLLLPSFRAHELDVLDLLALSVIAVLALSPAALGDIRFQLAFAGLSAGLRLYPALAAKIPRLSALPRPARAPIHLLLLALAIALGTSPLAARLFDHVTLLSLAIAPLAVIVTIGLAAPLSILGGALALITPALGGPLLGAAALSIDGLLFLLPVQSSTSASIPTPSVIECVIFYAIIAAIAAKPLRVAGVLSVVLLAWSGIAIWKRSAGDHLEAAILPASSGRAFVVRLPDGTILARDTSPPASWFQMEQRLVSNHLKLRRHTGIDVLIADPGDDLSAARELAQQLPIAEVWWTRPPPDPVALETDRILDAPIERGGARIQSMQGGLQIEVGGRSLLFASTASTATTATRAAPDAIVLPDGSVRAEGQRFSTREHGMIRIRIENGALIVLPLRTVH